MTWSIFIRCCCFKRCMIDCIPKIKLKDALFSTHLKTPLLFSCVGAFVHNCRIHKHLLIQLCFNNIPFSLIISKIIQFQRWKCYKCWISLWIVDWFFIQFSGIDHNENQAQILGGDGWCLTCKVATESLNWLFWS